MINKVVIVLQHNLHLEANDDQLGNTGIKREKSDNDSYGKLRFKTSNRNDTVDTTRIQGT